MPPATEVRRLFARIAKRYDRTNDLLSLGVHRTWRHKVVRAAAVSPGAAVLDVCCGTGDVTLAFAAQGARAVGVDFCAEMLEHARRKIVDRAATRFVAGDALRLPFADAEFDAVTVAFGIRNVADPSAGLSEMARVCRPGGSVVVLEFCHPRLPVFAALYRGYFRNVMPRLGALFSGDRAGAYRYLQRTVDAFPERDAFAALMTAAGLRNVTHSVVACGIACVTEASLDMPDRPDRARPAAPPRLRGSSPARPLPARTYFTWSRDPATSLFAVLPLWLAYESLRLLLAPGERNGAEVLVGQSLRALGPHAVTMVRWIFAITVVFAAWTLHKRNVPWARVAAVIVLEGTVYGLMLGPLASALASSSERWLGATPGLRLSADLVASLGAGLFEELVFRLALVSILSLLLARVCEVAKLPLATPVVMAVIVSAFAFSLFHHVGAGAPPIQRDVFLFRVAAGLLLGFLFVFRGFGVAVYTHALYDVHYYLTHHG